MIISNVYSNQINRDNYKTKEKDNKVNGDNVKTNQGETTKETSSEKTTKAASQGLGVDTFVKSDENDALETYKPVQKKKLTTDEVQALKDQQKNNELELIKQFVSDTVKNQSGISSSLSKSSADLLTKVFGSLDKAFPPVTNNPEDAKKAISKGGDYSVEAVSDRIMKLAKALAGDDPDKIAKMRQAVEKGFASAGLDFENKTKNKLPQICNDTHDEIMKRFDAWEKEVSEKNSDKNEPVKDAINK